jgi:peptide/nickel transport system substrate-binding protein
MQSIWRAVVAGGFLLLTLGANFALAQKAGGTLRVYFFDSPGSMSIHEESTIAAEGPMMAVFNNLVLFKQDVRQNSLQSIVPDLATSWTWNADYTRLTFKLREGVKWHDGKPFTSKDVQCTWNLLLGKAPEKLRINPRRAWYGNLDEIATEGDHDVTFKLKRPQPAFLVLLASGFSPVYPCHVSPKDMRTKPIGTGPFKFVEFKPNETIKVVKNPDYWKPGRPYLDGIDYTIIRSLATGVLAFVAGKVDITSYHFLQVPMLADVKSQAPNAICDLVPANVSRTVIINPKVAPFDKKELRQAVSLTIDRKAFIDTNTMGKGDVGGAMLPQPEGVWGMPPEMLKTLPGYDPDVPKNRAEGRKIMEKLGYGAANRLKVKLSTRNIPPYRDSAVILIDHLKEIYIDAELELVETATWYPKITRKDFTIGLNLVGNGLDEPDQTFYESYSCGAESNFDGYCNPEVDKLIDQQSAEVDQEKRKKLVWAIERKLVEDGARPVIYHNRSGTCHWPYVKGYQMMVNSIYNGLRLEDVWLDK